MHDIWVRRGDAQKLRHLLSPDSQIGGAFYHEVIGDGRDVMDQAELGFRVFVSLRRREDLQVGIRKTAGLLPEVDSGLRAWREDQGWLFGACLAFGIGSQSFHVIAANLVLCTIPAGRASQMILCRIKYLTRGTGNLPLREGFVTSDMSTLASFAALAALCMAPPGRTCTLSGHV